MAAQSCSIADPTWRQLQTSHTSKQPRRYLVIEHMPLMPVCAGTGRRGRWDSRAALSPVINLRSGHALTSSVCPMRTDAVEDVVIHGGLHLDARLQALKAKYTHVTSMTAANAPATMPTTGVSDAARSTGAGHSVPGFLRTVFMELQLPLYNQWRPNCQQPACMSRPPLGKIYCQHSQIYEAVIGQCTNFYCACGLQAY